ncbi:MAG: glycosyltransferase [Deltaproteobacteria bacterium]|nr:glycosyltransferase [Deltaproteobacteria bacterium]
MPPKVSVVINTYNRAKSLENTLRSLSCLTYGDLEVIVVNGPSTDSTAKLLESFGDRIKAGVCPEANLSMSRNIGICMAAGEIVAFIDDDAIPEPEWLSEIVDGYDSAEIGGVGGLVYDHTGYSLQYGYATCDRLGNAIFDHGEPALLYNFPLSKRFPYLQGTNCSFRRDLLLQIGGFDEEYEFYLDETDVCLRIVDRGYLIKQLNKARVHHKFAPSHIRNEHRVTANLYPVMKNKIYFSIKNTRECEDISLNAVIRDASVFIDRLAEDTKSHFQDRRLTAEDLSRFWRDVDRAWSTGIMDGLAKDRVLITPEKIERHSSPYRKFPTSVKKGGGLCICYLSQDFPPGHNGGIARFTHDLAMGVAALGHQVHVITKGKGHSTVDFEDGVWVHRIVPEERGLNDIPRHLPVYRKNLGYALSAYEEVLRINERRRVDLVEAPIWDAEGLKCMEDERFSTVISLETTVKIAADSQPDWDKSPDIRKLIEVETGMLRSAEAFHAISSGIIKTIEDKYGVRLAEDRIGLVPLGVKDESPNYSRKRADGSIMVLFVGRLEKRKGIDVLLECVPSICSRFGGVRFVIAGDDTILNENGKSFKDEFLMKNPGRDFLGRVEFAGRVPDEELYQLYADCDIFVAPSRYESFGLIFLEAMAFSKPVIGCEAGGMVEIIRKDENGLLAGPGDVETLMKALEDLITDNAKRERFGRRSREIFENSFTMDRMSAGMVEFYKKVISRKSAGAASAPVRVCSDDK